MAKVEEETKETTTTTRKEERQAGQETHDRRSFRRGEMVIVDLGKKSPRDIRDLRKGRGRLMDDVEQIVADLQDAGTIHKDTQPLVIVAEQRIGGVLLPILVPPGIPGLFPSGLERGDDEDDTDDDSDDD